VNLVGTATMPLFFLLSGFVLVLNDGKTMWALQVPHPHPFTPPAKASSTGCKVQLCGI
jgi:hypothetical protein